MCGRRAYVFDRRIALFRDVLPIYYQVVMKIIGKFNLLCCVCGTLLARACFGKRLSHVLGSPSKSADFSSPIHYWIIRKLVRPIGPTAKFYSPGE